MEITTDTKETINDSYDEFEKTQLVAKLPVGEKLTISIDDIVIKEYTAKYINCHFNLIFQDKGEKIDLELLTEAELLQRQIDRLEAEKTALEAE